jgi:hypothetical protein
MPRPYRIAGVRATHTSRIAGQGDTCVAPTNVSAYQPPTDSDTIIVAPGMGTPAIS